MKRFLLSYALLFIASNALGQHWTKLPDPAQSVIGHKNLCPYFVNADYGFAFRTAILSWGGLYPSDELNQGSSTYLLPSPLWRTTDGGQSWTQIDFFDSIGFRVSQLFFVSPERGFASAILPGLPYSGGVFETNDSGSHWKQILNDGHAAMGIYASNNTVFVSEFLDTGLTKISLFRYFDDQVCVLSGPLKYSRDDGSTWDSVTNVAGLTLKSDPSFQYIYGNRDSLVASVYYDSIAPFTCNTYLIFSTDLGRTWQSRLLDPGYPWPSVMLHISPHSCNIVRSYVDATDFTMDMYSFLWASYPYASWSLTLSDEISGWIAGNDCALYVPYAGENDQPNFYRSTNQGASWTGVQWVVYPYPYFGEMDDADFQCLAVVEGGKVIYAFSDLSERLWKTTDGGDGSLNAAALSPQFALSHNLFQSGTDTFTYNVCQPDSLIQAHNQNIACSYARFDSITIDGLLPSEYSQTSTHHCGCTPMPDTTFITLHPKTPGVRDLTMHYHFTDDEFNQIDTSIQITLDVKAGGGAVALNAYLKPANISVSAGDTIDIPIYLSGNTTLVGSTSILLPIVLDTNILHPIGFYPATSGITAGPPSYSKGTETVPLQATDLTLNGETLIGTLRCVVYLVDTLQTSVSLSGAAIASSDPSCLVLSANADAVNILIQGCGDATLLRYMATGSPFEVTGITPNPLSDGATISFTLAVESKVAISVIDAAGRETSLLSQEMPAGQHEVPWDATRFASGVYTCRLSAGGASVVRKMVVLH